MKFYRLTSLVVVASALSACTGYSMQQTRPMPTQMGYPSAQQPQFSAQQMPVAQTANTMITGQQQDAELTALRERVRRVERAMIRLDRRMQLIERNALSNITGSLQEESPDVNQLFQPMSYEQKMPASRVPAQRKPVAKQQLRGQPFVQNNGLFKRTGYQPQATQQQQQNGMITSSLQPAPQGVKAMPVSMTDTSNNLASKLPSLADQKAEQESAASVAIWTIAYEDRKIWPGRDQLVGSKEVVHALRSEKPVAIFARGARPTSKEFRERVRALSKYLGRVADIDNIAIASMPASHLDGDTIEILATR